MTLKDVFKNEKEQVMIKLLLKKLHLICSSLDIRDISWLQSEPTSGNILFLCTKYVCVGIAPHIDENFEGPVFIIIAYIGENPNYRKKLNENNKKKISFGMKGSYVLNAGATIDNKEKQLYFFYGFVTDFGVHGVQKMPGYECVILIIRKARTTTIDRS